MSKMSNLNLSIQEIAKDDTKLHLAITRQMQEYLNGTRPLHNLSYEARCALESYETGNDDIIEDRELQAFKLPVWKEFSILARIMLPIALVFLFTSPAIARSYHGHKNHKISTHIPKSWIN